MFGDKFPLFSGNLFGFLSAHIGQISLSETSCWFGSCCLVFRMLLMLFLFLALDSDCFLLVPYSFCQVSDDFSLFLPWILADYEEDLHLGFHGWKCLCLHSSLSLKLPPPPCAVDFSKQTVVPMQSLHRALGYFYPDHSRPVFWPSIPLYVGAVIVL